MNTSLLSTSPKLLSSGWRHLALGDVNSTNDIAQDFAKSGDEGQLWITGARQLAGRGRQGRAWISEAGNLYASALLIKRAYDLNRFSTLPFVVAVSMLDMFQKVAPDYAGQFGLKWPNDILLGGAKLAGILIETIPLESGQRAIIIGCGINLAHAPEDTPYPATSLHAKGLQVEPQEAFIHLQSSITYWLDQWNDGRNIAPVLNAWRKSAIGVGQDITVRLPQETLHGIFADIDEAGYLILRLPSGQTRRIAAGDVFFNRV